jgi:hypothetical protein
VNHASAHRDQQRAYAVHEPSAFQRANTTGCQREVDRAPALLLPLTRIGATLEDPDGKAASGEQDGQQCARQAGADDVDGLF